MKKCLCLNKKILIFDHKSEFFSQNAVKYHRKILVYKIINLSIFLSKFLNFTKRLEIFSFCIKRCEFLQKVSQVLRVRLSIRKYQNNSIFPVSRREHLGNLPLDYQAKFDDLFFLLVECFRLTFAFEFSLIAFWQKAKNDDQTRNTKGK